MQSELNTPEYFIRSKTSRFLRTQLYDRDCDFNVITAVADDRSRGLREIKILSVVKIGVSLESQELKLCNFPPREKLA